MKHSTHRLAAIMTTGALMSGSSAAFATGASFKDVTDNIVGASSNFPNLVSTVAYIGGIGMGVAGIFKLKAHVDAPAQHAMKDGLIRLGAGGGLLALPYITSAMIGSISNGGTGTAPAVSGFATGLGGTNVGGG